MDLPESEPRQRRAASRLDRPSRRAVLQAAAGVGLAAGLGRLLGGESRPAHAQGAPPLVGMLVTGGRGGNPLTAFGDRLVEHGWIDGETVRLEYRYAEGDETRLPALAAELAPACRWRCWWPREGCRRSRRRGERPAPSRSS